MRISIGQYANNFSGYLIKDCAVRSKDIFYFSLSTDASQFPHPDEGNDAENGIDSSICQRIISYNKLLPPEEQWDCEEFSGIESFSIAVTKNPKEQMVGVELDGVVFVYGGGENEVEEPVGDFVNGGILRGGVSRCRSIDGSSYIAGGGRTVAVRSGKNIWTGLMDGLPFTYNSDWKSAGFNDIDGFSASDIYAVGRMGDVWHFDGKIWEQIHFPSDIHLYTVCCAGDGAVYISGYQGNTFKGRGNKWKQIHKGAMTLSFRDMIWHEDQIWCTSDYGLWQISDEKLVVAEVDSEIAVCSGHLSTCGDVMLLGGHSGAAYKESGVWHKIF